MEVRSGDALGAPDRAPFGGISVTAAARDEPPAALFEQLAPGAALVCPVERGRRELLVRFRDGEEGPWRRSASCRSCDGLSNPTQGR